MEQVPERPKQHIDEVTHAVSGAVYTLKNGASFVSFSAKGQIQDGVEASGLFYGDTQMISDWRVDFGDDLELVSAVLSPESAGLTLKLQSEKFLVTRDLTLHDGLMQEKIEIINRTDDAATLPVTFAFGSHFYDMFRIRGDKSVQSGPVSAVFLKHALQLNHQGLDARQRQSGFYFSLTPDRIDSPDAETHSAQFSVTLKPGERKFIILAGGQPREEGYRPTPAKFRTALKNARDDFRAIYRQAAWIESDSAPYNELIQTSQKDLAILLTKLDTGFYPYAGLPWYATTFGRDGIITALQLMPFKPEIAKGVIAMLSLHQATGLDPKKEAEPGKVFHEMRAGESSRSGQNYFDCYYGGIDTTPLYVMLAGEYFERTNDLEFIREQWPHLKMALDWMVNYGDLDGDGLLEHRVPQDRKGLTVQSWMDSGDSMFDAQGRLPDGPLAICDVQGDAYAAFSHGARMAEALGLDDEKNFYTERAALTKKVFNEKFWSEELGTYVRALDGYGAEKKPCVVKGSNPGQLLYTGIVPEERAEAVIRSLMAPDSYSGFGIRTLAKGQPRYNPLGYHNGTVWPHDNSLIAMGMARYGFKDEAMRLMKSQFDAASGFKDRRIPELFSGEERVEGQPPEIYPAACSPQAWAAASSLLFLQMAVEMRIDPVAARLSIEAKALPDYMGNLTIRHVPVGNRHCNVRIINNVGEKLQVKARYTP